jgi:16S rRNA (uracil1498-N3)-methyltransferase
MELPEVASNHAIRVLRLSEGDALRVFDDGLEFAATIAAIDRRRVRIEVGPPVASLPERPVRLWLIMSPLKGDLTELVIQKATELGVDRISPAIFERTDTVARRDPNAARLARWHRVATSAAEQSGRAKVPRVDPAAPLKQVVSTLGDPDEGDLRVVAAEPSLDRRGGAPRDPAGVRSVLVAVGPAGGLTEGDLDVLAAASFLPERFARHTLRSETACLAALAILGDRFP